MNIISIDSEKCVGCNSCLRVCPSEEANITHFVDGNSRIIIDINDDACIRCGACIKACSHNARTYIDDTSAMIESLSNEEEVALIVAPAIKIAFDGNWRHVLAWLRSKGAGPIYDVSFGADICTWAHLRYLEQNPNKKLITQPCAAIVNYILKKDKDLLEHLSPVNSPMMCTAIYLRKYCGFTGKIAAISPCIAKKDEFTQTNNIINYNVTLNYLKDFLDTNKVSLPLPSIYSNFEFDNEPGYLGAIYSNPGGLKENLLHHKPDLKIINSEGLHKVYKDLDDYINTADDYLPSVFDVLNCECGCNGGSAVGEEYKTFRISSIMHDVKMYNLSQQAKNTNKKGVDQQFAFFDQKLNISDFTREYVCDEKTNQKISPTELEKAFVSMSKFTTESRHFDCHSCGFSSCHQMATAVAKGLNVPENCHQHTKYMVVQKNQNMFDVSEKISVLSNQLVDIVNQLQSTIKNTFEDVSSINTSSSKCSDEIDIATSYTEELISLNQNITVMLENINKNVMAYQNMTNDVESIAQSINLLSLNASIEAARAGEAGKGFSVVATNIRELSDSSKASVSSAKQNEIVITNSIENVYKTVNKFSENMDNLSKVISTTKGCVESTNLLSQDIQNALDSLIELSNNITIIANKTSETASSTTIHSTSK